MRVIPKLLFSKRIFWAMLNVAFFVPFWRVGAGAGPPPSGITNPLGGITSVSALITVILDVVLQIGISVAAGFIIWSGFLYVSARGNETKLAMAHKTFTWTIIGVVVLMGAWVIAEALASTICSVGGGVWNSVTNVCT